MIEWNIDVSQQSDRKLPMDIFVPESDRLRGALLFLHGGGFVGGRKEQFLGICASAALKTAGSALRLTIGWRAKRRFRRRRRMCGRQSLIWRRMPHSGASIQTEWRWPEVRPAGASRRKAS